MNKHKANSPARRRWSLGLMLAALLGLVATSLPAFAYTTATGTWPNFPNDGKYRGLSSSTDPWVGNYAVKPAGGSQFLISYCMDPNSNGPSSGGQYSGVHNVTSLTRDDGSGTMTSTQMAQTAYILWKWGSTTDGAQAARVDAATYTTEGYANYNIFNSGSWGYKRVNSVGQLSGAQAYVTEARKYAGPYHLSVTNSPAAPTAGGTITVTAKLLTAANVAVPGISFNLDYNGTTVAVTSDSAGAAVHTFATPNAGAFKVTATATNVAPTYVALVNPAPGTGAQNMAIAGDKTSLASGYAVTVNKATPKVTTAANTAVAGLGNALFDKVTVTNATGVNTIKAVLYGPFPAVPTATSCVSTAVAGSAFFNVTGNGTFNSPTVTPTNPGYYVWVEQLVGNTNNQAVTTPCGISQETTLVKYQPVLVTQTSAQQVFIGSSIKDTVKVSGTGGNPITVNWTLLGPVAAVNNSCSGVNWTGAATAATGSFPAAGDGTYTTTSTKVAASGCYTYSESSPATNQTETATSPAGQASETTLSVLYSPTLHTTASAQAVGVNASIHDTVAVAGTGGNPITVNWTLLGPVAAINDSCTGVSYAGAPTADSGSFTAAGDGTYTTASTKVTTMGCYTYSETSPATATTNTATSPAGQTSETVLVSKYQPTLGTTISSQNAIAGDSVHDTILVGNTGGNPLTLNWTLFGPVAPVNNSCSGVSYTGAATAASGTLSVTGDGTYTTPATKLAATGCYTYEEDSAATTDVYAATSPSGQTSETVLVVPASPQLHTTASAQSVVVGGSINDTVVVSGTNGNPIVVDWTLLGPVAPNASGTCTGLNWTGAATADSGSFNAPGDGTYKTSSSTVKATGCFTYVENAAATPNTNLTTTPPGSPPETFLSSPHQPTFITHASATSGLVGTLLHDNVTVTGLMAGDKITMVWTLLGPAAPLSGALTCDGIDWSKATVAATGSMPVTGNGTVTTPATKLAASGCYTFVETAASTPTTKAATGGTPGQVLETALVTKTPPHRTPEVPTGSNGGAVGNGSNGGADLELGLGALLLLGAGASGVAMSRRRKEAA